MDFLGLCCSEGIGPVVVEVLWTFWEYVVVG